MKNLYEDQHYTFDETTRIITFKKDHITYINEKQTFAEHGIDIDEIQTVNEYDKLRMEYRYVLLEAFQQTWRKVKPINIEEKYEKALALYDVVEINRLKKIINIKRKLNIKIITTD